MTPEMKPYDGLCKDPHATPSERETALLKEWNKALRSRDFYKLRCDRLQEVQHLMRDPERKMVCDILANGKWSGQDYNP